MLSTCKRLIREERAQGLVEYALIIAFVSIAVVGALREIAPPLKAIFEKTAKDLEI